MYIYIYIYAVARNSIGNIYLSSYEVTAFKNCSDLDTRKRENFLKLKLKAASAS